MDAGSADTTPDVAVNQAAPNQIALTILQARRGKLDGQWLPLELSINIANGEGGAPVSVNPSLFQVQTTDGLLTRAESQIPRFVSGPRCEPTTSIAGGHSYRCVVSVDLQPQAEPVELDYQTPGAVTGQGSDQRTASVPITLEACHTCGQDCTYLDVDEMNCGSCGNDLSNRSGQSCVDGHRQCDDSSLTPCAEADGTVWCVDLQSDISNCGACGNEAPANGDCSNGQPTCGANYTQCGSVCVDLSSDFDNCGACGAAVGAHQRCTDGHPTCNDGLTMCGSTCADLQTDPDHCGACDVQAPTGGSCSVGQPICPSQQIDCNGECVQKLFDRLNCGGCGITCDSGQQCIGGECI